MARLSGAQLATNLTAQNLIELYDDGLIDSGGAMDPGQGAVVAPREVTIGDTDLQRS